MQANQEKEGDEQKATHIPDENSDHQAESHMCNIVHALSMSWGSNFTSRLGNTSLQLLQAFCWAMQHCEVYTCP